MDAERKLQAFLHAIAEIAVAEHSAGACAAALEAAVTTLGIPCGWIQRDDGGGAPRIACAHGTAHASHRAAERVQPWPATSPAPGIVVVEAAPGAPGSLADALRADGLCAATFVPMTAGGRLFGALVLVTEGPRTWTDGELGVAEGIARLAAAAIARDRERAGREGLERELLQAQRLKSVGRLAGVLAHDFNNVLTAMIGNIDMVSAGLPPDTEEQGYLAQALEAAGLATELSRQLLEFARRQPEPRTAQNLNALLERFAPLVRRLVPDSIRLVTRPLADPAWLLADAGQIEQVIVNFALRARDSMPEGGEMTLSAINVGDPGGGPGWVALEAADTGEGLAAGVVRGAPVSFEFAGEGGPALELAIIAALVRASGGRMEADSDAAAGTRVRACWPLTVPPGIPAEPTGAVPGGRETVLFVEADSATRDLAATTLGRLGYEVLTATGADEALRWLEQNPDGAQLLIADLVLPGMGGRELVLRARETRPRLRVLLTSGYAAAPGATVIAGGLAFLPKPFTGDALARRVREALDAPPAGTGGAQG